MNFCPECGSQVEVLAEDLRRAAARSRRSNEAAVAATREVLVLQSVAAIERALDVLDEASLAAALALAEHEARCGPLSARARVGESTWAAGDLTLALRERRAGAEGIEVELRCAQEPDARARELLGALASCVLGACARRALLDAKVRREVDRERHDLSLMLAHRANSPLTAALVELHLLREELPNPAALDALQGALRRVSGIVAAIRSLADRKGLRRLDAAELLAALDQRRTSKVRDGALGASIVAEALPLLRGLEELGAAIPDAEVTAGAGGEGVVLRLSQGAWPEALVPSGARLRGGELLLPFEPGDAIT